MVFVPSGEFTMGCTFEQGSECAYDERPSHKVTLRAYAIAKYPVTQALWKAVMGSNPSRFKGDDLPVESVSWDEVQMFIKRLNQLTGLNYRLPTEAEWEFAARGGLNPNPTRFCGGAELPEYGWYFSNAENTTHPVGLKRPNTLGIYDMSGNVWEWCSDYYGKYPDDDVENPTGPSKGSARVLRGGAFSTLDKQCRVTSRKSLYQAGKDFSTGFRLAMDDDREAIEQAARERAEQEAAEAVKRAELEAAEAAERAEKERMAAQEVTEKAEREAKEAADRAEKERLAEEKAKQVAAEKAERAEKKRISYENTTKKNKVNSTHKNFFGVNGALDFETASELSSRFFVGLGVGFDFAIPTSKKAAVGGMLTLKYDLGGPTHFDFGPLFILKDYKNAPAFMLGFAMDLRFPTDKYGGFKNNRPENLYTHFMHSNFGAGATLRLGFTSPFKRVYFFTDLSLGGFRNTYLTDIQTIQVTEEPVLNVEQIQMTNELGEPLYWSHPESREKHLYFNISLNVGYRF